jgi:CYTH domain-containing protein
MAPEPMKYRRVEYERRFLVSPLADWRASVETYSKTFTDRYVRGTRLRLRAMEDSDSGRRAFKLTKKLASDSPYHQTIGSIVLTAGEFELLAALPGDVVRKVRHYHRRGEEVFSVDVFEGQLAGLLLCEVEAQDVETLMRIHPPAYAPVEVTEDPFFTGGNLCRTTRAELLRKLEAAGAGFMPRT